MPARSSSGVRLASMLATLIAVAQPAHAAQLPPSDVTVIDGPGLRLTVFSASMLASASTATTLVGVEIDGIAEDLPTIGTPRRLDISVRSGSIASTMSVPIDEPATIGRAAREGVRVTTRLSLPPGRHELQVIVRDTGAAESRAALHAVNVPNLLENSITMSDLVVSGSRVGGVSRVDTQDVLPILGRPPTGRRVFARDEQLEVNAQIYTEELTPADDDACIGQLSVILGIVTADGRVLDQIFEAGQGETLPSGVYGYQYYALVPLTKLAPGNYSLRVTALNGVSSAVRTVPITIIDAR